MELKMELSQKQILSQHMVQSMEILQMSAQELEGYIEKLALENPVIELAETSPVKADTHQEDLQRKLDWLESTDLQNRVYYQQERSDENMEANWHDSRQSEENLEEYLHDVDGILVPGGFGQRGTEGKILAIGYARRNKIPYLGLCLGMQLAIVEFARNVAGLSKAASIELDPETPDPVIALMPEQNGITNLGGTLRLGAYPCVLQPETLAHELYGKTEISERHRHRYEVNNDYREVLTKNGMVLSGLSPDGRIVEMIELKEHPFFVATQAHPEFKSRPNLPHPLFEGFVKAAVAYEAAGNSAV